MNKADLRLDWCSYQAAKWAVEHWHYSKRMPSGKLVKIGVYERGEFIGVVLFGWGATSALVKAYGLKQTQGAELVRVALKQHESTVSRIVSIALKMLKKEMQGLRLVVSFADPDQSHVGGIYQAGGWFYCGMSQASDEYIVNGRRYQGRSFRNSFGGMEHDQRVKIVKGSSKYRYLYPLDDAMRQQIEPLRKPYPKRVPRGSGEIDNAADTNLQTGGARPTDPLLGVTA